MGDGDCNVARSWIWAAVRGGFHIVIGAPKAFQPAASFLATLPDQSNLTITDDPIAAVTDADAIYTDVWVSMGKEVEATERIEILRPWQINDTLMTHTKPGALVMHCLPAYRGKEITNEVMEAHATTIFDQAENRLHAQKAILVSLSQRS
jgi:ornithine carbamoyltransferase